MTHGRRGLSTRLLPDILALGLILGVNAVYLGWRPFIGFNFFDYGSFLDAGWRVYGGQIPFIDFMSHVGPGHFYLLAVFYLLFGFGKAALWAHMVALSSILTIGVYAAVARGTSRTTAILSAALTAVGFYWPMAHPWYDQSAFFWGLLASLWLIFRLPDLSRKRAFWTGFICGFAAMASMLTKFNIGAAFGLVFVPPLALSANRKSSLLGYLAGLTVVAAVFFLIVPVPAFLDQTFGFIRHSQGRMLALLSPQNWLRNYYWIALGVVTLNFRRSRAAAPLFALFIGLIFAGIFALFTGSIAEGVHYPAMGPIIGLGFILLRRFSGSPDKKFIRRIQKPSVVVLGVLAIWLAALDANYGIRGNWAKGSAFMSSGEYSIKAAPFRGWKTGRLKGEALDGLAGFVEAHVKENESLLVLTDMNILYALTGRKSYEGIPFIMLVDQVPLPGRQVDEVRNRILTDEPRWIVVNLKPDILWFSTDLLVPYLKLPREFISKYRVAGAWNNYAILKLESPG